MPSNSVPPQLAQLFGMCDTIAQCFHVECWSWKLFAIVFFLCGPFLFFCVAVFKVHKLVAKNRTLRSAGLVFNDSPARSLKEMWQGIRDVPGGSLPLKLSQAFVYMMEIRFRGGWAKKDEEARFWGFLMGAYTDKFWLIVAWVLSKKILVSLNKHLLDGALNGAAFIFIFSADLLLFMWKRPFRDNLVNLSQVTAALGLPLLSFKSPPNCCLSNHHPTTLPPHARAHGTFMGISCDACRSWQR